MIFDYIDAPAKPWKGDNMSSSYARKGASTTYGDNGVVEFYYEAPFFCITSSDGLDVVQVDSENLDEIVLIVSAMLAVLPKRSIDRAIKLAEVLRTNPELAVDTDDIDEHIK